MKANKTEGKKAYKKPSVDSRPLKLGVYGSYGRDDDGSNSGGHNGGTDGRRHGGGRHHDVM